MGWIRGYATADSQTPPPPPFPKLPLSSSDRTLRPSHHLTHAIHLCVAQGCWHVPAGADDEWLCIDVQRGLRMGLDKLVPLPRKRRKTNPRKAAGGGSQRGGDGAGKIAADDDDSVAASGAGPSSATTAVAEEDEKLKRVSSVQVFMSGF